MALTQDLLKKLFEYRDGELYWKVARGPAKIGDRAGSVSSDSYRGIGLEYKQYFTHRLIFLYHYGFLPKFLDHIDGNPLNNSIDNLREATLSQNQHNRKKSKFYSGKLTTSKYKGVYWHKPNKKWYAQIQINEEQKHLGYFITEIEAAHAYDHAAIEAFGKFARLNEVMK